MPGAKVARALHARQQPNRSLALQVTRATVFLLPDAKNEQRTPRQLRPQEFNAGRPTETRETPRPSVPRCSGPNQEVWEGLSRISPLTYSAGSPSPESDSQQAERAPAHETLLAVLDVQPTSGFQYHGYEVTLSPRTAAERQHQAARGGAEITGAEADTWFIWQA